MPEESGKGEWPLARSGSHGRPHGASSAARDTRAATLPPGTRLGVAAPVSGAAGVATETAVRQATALEFAEGQGPTPVREASGGHGRQEQPSLHQLRQQRRGRHDSGGRFGEAVAGNIVQIEGNLEGVSGAGLRLEEPKVGIEIALARCLGFKDQFAGNRKLVRTRLRLPVNWSGTNCDVLSEGPWDTQGFLAELRRIDYRGFCSIGVYNTPRTRRECMTQCWKVIDGVIPSASSPPGMPR